MFCAVKLKITLKNLNGSLVKLCTDWSRHIVQAVVYMNPQIQLIADLPWTNPGRTVRADIHVNICKSTDVRVELSLQPRIPVVNRDPISIAPISARISARISVLRISECEVHCGYAWLYGRFDTYIRNFEDNRVHIQEDIRTDSSAREGSECMGAPTWITGIHLNCAQSCQRKYIWYERVTLSS